MSSDEYTENRIIEVNDKNKTREEVLYEILERILADILLTENKNGKDLFAITIPVVLFKDLAGTKMRLLQDIILKQKRGKP